MFKNELKRITEVLLQPEDDFQQLTTAIEELYQLFLKVSGLETEAAKNRQDIQLSGGKAIGPVWAGLCVKEILRTKRFLRGLFLGVKAALKRFPNRPIHVVYAGTGPFATLFVPLTTVFTSDEVKFTLLEINPISIKYLKRVVSAFVAEQYVKEIIECDATTYQMNNNDPIQLIVSETMQNALQKEPQVEISLNLMPQLAEGGIFIPQNIKVEVVLLDPQKNMERMTSLDGFDGDYYLSLGTIFELNIDAPKAYPVANLSYNDLCVFPKVELEIARDISKEYRQLCLFTTIQVFGEEQLAPWQCSLTMPKNIKVPNQADKPLSKIVCQYQIGQSPGFGVEIL